MRHMNLMTLRRSALPLALLILAGCAKPQAQPPTGTPKRVPLQQAQALVDFVIYTPAYLPAGAAVGDALVVPEQMVGEYLLPNEIALELGSGVSIWEMPDGALPLPSTGVPVRLNGRTGWLSSAAGLGRRSLEWQIEGTRVGLSGTVETALLLRIANSFEPAHPDVEPRPVSERRARLAPGLATPLPPGGIGAHLAPGPPAFVTSVYPGLPADRAGIQPGDQLIAVDGEPLADTRPEGVARKVRGPLGSTVQLTLRPRGGRAQRAVTLSRAAVPVLHRERVTERAARERMATAVLTPSYLPERFRLAELNLGVWDPNPAGLQPDLRALYDGPRRAVLIIAQRPAAATWPPWTPPAGSEPVTVGSAQARIGRTPDGATLLLWRDGDTALQLFAMGLARDEVLRVAQSMRPAEAAP